MKRERGRDKVIEREKGGKKARQTDRLIERKE